MVTAANNFIRLNTRLMAPSAVPELQMWLADEVTPLWQATEAWLEARNCPPPYWAFAWAGGQALARYILDNPLSVQGRRVFDFAAGGGIASLAALKAGAASATANEIDDMAMQAIKLNADANEAMVTIVAGDMANDDLAGFDLILAGDVCYEPAMTARLLPWLRRLSGQGKEVWLADPGRAYLPQSGLERLGAYDIPVTADLESCAIRSTTVYRLLP